MGLEEDWTSDLMDPCYRIIYKVITNLRNLNSQLKPQLNLVAHVTRIEYNDAIKMLTFHSTLHKRLGRKPASVLAADWRIPFSWKTYLREKLSTDSNVTVWSMCSDFDCHSLGFKIKFLPRDWHISIFSTSFIGRC